MENGARGNDERFRYAEGTPYPCSDYRHGRANAPKGEVAGRTSAAPIGIGFVKTETKR